MASKNAIKCRRCDRRYSRLRHKCPYCGAKKKGNSKRAIYDTTPKWQLVVSVVILLIVAAVVVTLIIMSLNGRSADKDNGSTNDDPSSSDTLDTDDGGVNDVVDPNGSGDTAEDPVDTVKVTSVAIDRTDFTMSEIGEQVTITATIAPADADVKVEWVSGDTEVCAVSSSGVVTAINKGTTTVYAVADGVKSTECVVRVTAGTGTVDSGGTLSLSHTDVTISSASSETFTLSVSGASGTPTYSSANTSVATVSAAGRVTAVSAGNTTVTVTVDGKTLECIVRVN